MGVSPGFKTWGSRYQTSQTTAQEVMSCSRCIVNDCLKNGTWFENHLPDITTICKNTNIDRQATTKNVAEFTDQIHKVTRKENTRIMNQKDPTKERCLF